MAPDTVLKIIAQGAWNGGTIVDNSIYEKTDLYFKGGIPVNRRTIEERIGIRTRVAAPPHERIGVSALQDLLTHADIDPSRIKVIIGATNVGDDKYDPGPLIRFPFELIRRYSPKALVFDLYAGCPGFNVAVDLDFMLSLNGFLKPGDISVIVGAENIHRAQAFKSDNTANIIFGDDALSTALETQANLRLNGRYSHQAIDRFFIQKDYASEIAQKIIELNGRTRIDGIIVDNQLGKLQHRIPATATRVQNSLVRLMYPDEAQKGTFRHFKDALAFYDQKITMFAYDIMSLEQDPAIVQKIAKAYVQSGKHHAVVSVYLSADQGVRLTLHRGEDYIFSRPRTGIMDTLTATHGCFAHYIQAVVDNGDCFGEMDGKGVFLYATRGATTHLTKLLSRNNLTINDIDLLFEHQANFAIIPLTLEQIFKDTKSDSKNAAAEFVAAKMPTNIHTRGNCSVVCMQRLPYDLQRGVLKEATIQGYPVNRNLQHLKGARTILSDSVGAGMTRSAFLQKKETGDPA